MLIESNYLLIIFNQDKKKLSVRMWIHGAEKETKKK